jgi:D-alanine-D-alanine ligase
LTIDRDGMWRDREDRPLGITGAAHVLRSCDVAVPAVHGPRGEDGTLAALFELAGLPYVGSGVPAGAIAMDKWVTKLVAEALGVATAPGRLLTEATAPSYPWTHPVVVKPVTAGSSHGVTLVREPAGLGPALDAALALDRRVLVEDVVDGREIDIAVLGRSDGERIASPALEIVADGLFDYATKYGGDADFRIPAALDEVVAKELADSAVAVFDALGCAGVARVDFFLTGAGWVLNEVNTMPGFTEASQAPKMFAAAGLPYPELLDLMITDALRAGPR